MQMLLKKNPALRSPLQDRKRKLLHYKNDSHFKISKPLKWLAVVLTVILMTLGCSVSSALSKELTIQIIAGSAIDAVSERQLQRYFSLRQKLLPNNQPVTLVRLPMESSITMQFTNRVFEVYPYQLQRIWDRQVYSGKAKAPASAKSEHELIGLIANTPNSLGYISADTPIPALLKGKVNVIAVY